ncbi:MAG: ABC transporter ATP-binding protein [Gemmatimonadaceae bacterium]
MQPQSSPLVSDAVLVDGVARRFAGRWALRGASMRARRGEVLAIRGSNGSGKSTLLRIVASALRPTRGTCLVFGHDVVHEAAAVRKLVGLLGHSPALYQDLTVAENLCFAARMMGIRDDDRLIASVIGRVALEAATHERARTLSSGMQRRVALARLMIRPPALLLLDEPHNSFDAEGVALARRPQDRRTARSRSGYSSMVRRRDKGCRAARAVISRPTACAVTRRSRNG